MIMKKYVIHSLLRNTKVIKIIFFIFLLLFFHALTWGQARYVVTNLNLREGPGVKSKVITTIPRGVSVTIEDDCDCKWVPVSYNGYVGYIYTKYLSKERPSTNYYHSSNNKKNAKYYTNSRGERVQSPTYYDSRPSGASALCRDGTYSFSRSRRGTCSHHGGVARWY